MKVRLKSFKICFWVIRNTNADFYLKQHLTRTQVCMQLTSLLALSLGPWSPLEHPPELRGHPRHHLHLPVWPQRAAGKVKGSTCQGDRLPVSLQEPGLAPGAQASVAVSYGVWYPHQQLLPETMGSQNLMWTEPESSLTASDLKKEKKKKKKERANQRAKNRAGLGIFLPLLWETFTSCSSSLP